jgi:hypothetical protein
MPFDPTLPVANSPNSSAEMRAQLNALKALIDAQGSVATGRLASDWTSGTSSFSDVPGLSFSVASGENWTAEIVLHAVRQVPFGRAVPRPSWSSTPPPARCSFRPITAAAATR